jgi:hypothetical protein
MALPLPEHGERALIVGQTGSGKTAFAVWLLDKLETSPFVIYDTKEEPKFSAMPNSVVAERWEHVNDLLPDPQFDYVIFRPDPHLQADKRALDDLLYRHWRDHRNVGAYIDEMYSFAEGVRPGAGITALLTKGRSRGNTTIMSTQRPSWIPGFCITEAQKYFLFHQADLKDKKRIAAVVPEYDRSPLLPRHHFHFFNQGEQNYKMYSPIKLIANGVNHDYVDATAIEASPPPLLWI